MNTDNMQECTCPLCDAQDVSLIFNRNYVPVLLNYLYESQEEALKAPKGNLSIVVCKQCGFIFNRDFYSELAQYGPGYCNSQSASKLFEQHIHNTVKFLENNANLEGKKVLEVGCGDGNFLKKLIAIDDNHCADGWDPSYVGDSTLFSKRLRFYNSIFKKSKTTKEYDLVIMRHLIEHIKKPLDFLQRMFPDQKKKPELFLETPDLNWTLKHHTFFDFHYEHASYFTSKTLRFLCGQLGYNSFIEKKAFEGQYLQLLAMQDTRHDDVSDITDEQTKTSQNITQLYQEWLIRWKNTLIDLSKDGPMAVWGAGAKGVAFANLFDHSSNLFNCIIDVNANKTEKYIPVTGHCVQSPSFNTLRELKTIIVMNGNYLAEVAQLIKQKHLDIHLVNTQEIDRNEDSN